MSEDVKDAVGFVLDRVQKGKHHPGIKPLSGKDLAGVHEIRVDLEDATYRAVYLLASEDRIFVLHVFKKKAKRGIATPRRDMDLIRRRVKDARILAKEIDR